MSEFGTGTAASNFTPLLRSLPQSCPSSEVAVGHVSAGQKVPFGIHTIWQGSDYFAFSTANDQPSIVAFSDVYNSLRMGGKIIQQTGASTWKMHLSDAAHYTITLDAAENILIQIRLLVDQSQLAQRSIANNADINGRWSATVTDAKVTSHVDVRLTENSEGQVVGEYSSSRGGKGNVTGVVVGTQFSFELTQTVENCPGTFKGNGVLEGDRIIGTYSGSDCLGDRGIGSLAMTRSAEITQSNKPAVTPSIVSPEPPTDGHLTVTAIGYRVIPHERTNYYTIAGHSNTTCYGSGTYMGFTASATVNCSTVTTPPQYRSLTIRSVEVFNQVEADGMIYTIRCTANWYGSSCSWLTPGDRFSAAVKGRDMWITAHKGGNLGKEIHAKYQMLDRRPKT